MAPLKVVPDPRPRIWRDPLPRFSWEYRQTRFRWCGDYGPETGGGLSIRHERSYWALTERGIRRKLARKIRAARRNAWRRHVTRHQSNKR